MGPERIIGFYHVEGKVGVLGAGVLWTQRRGSVDAALPPAASEVRVGERSCQGPHCEPSGSAGPGVSSQLLNPEAVTGQQPKQSENHARGCSNEILFTK